MNNITTLGWLDTSLMFANLRLRYWERLEGDGDLQTLMLREDEEGDLPILTGDKKFGSAVALLTRLRNAAAPFLGGHPADLGSVWIESLLPGGKTPWQQIDEGDMLRLVIALAAPPGSFLYCGGEAIVPSPGVVNYVNVGALHSSVNLGVAPRVWLIAHVRRPAPPEAA